MFKNAFAYVIRKKVKTLVLFLIIMLMATLCLTGLSIKSATDEAAKETFKNISNSFSMQINRRTNQGTPRGAGNLKSGDIDKIANLPGVEKHLRRMSAVADLVDLERVETEQTLENLDEHKRKYFGQSVMVTGVNDSSVEDKFNSGALQLKEGRHITPEDKNVVLLHESLMKKNNLKLGDKIKLKGNPYDADNVNQSSETTEVTIIGVFGGDNQGQVTYALELNDNIVISDLKTSNTLYNTDAESANYMDATFFLKGGENLDKVMSEAKKQDINWDSYTLFKSESNFPVLQESINGIYGFARTMFVGSLIFSGLVITLILFLWLNARKKEVAVLLSIGRSKLQIIGQFISEVLIISVFSFTGAYFLSKYTVNGFANGAIRHATKSITKKLGQAAAQSNLGGGAEAEGFNKTISELNVAVDPSHMIYVVLIGVVVLVLAVLFASYKIMKSRAIELLTDIK